MKSQSGQATLVMIAVTSLVICASLLALSIARVYISKERLQRAADIGVAVIETGHSRDQATAIINDNLSGDAEVSISTAHVSTDSTAPVNIDSPTVTIAQDIGVGFGISTRIEVAGMSHGYAVRTQDFTMAAGVARGEYSGKLVQVDAARVCPNVASQYRAMQHAASSDGVSLRAVSGYRSTSEQAVLYAKLGSAIAAPPGKSLHHQATELDISVGGTSSPQYRWLSANAPFFGFIQRYSWESWHWGNVRGC